ncbi:uncharacterized protein LOC111386752 isoform X2 [Olea europaea var. sylvestris]|uniref:uncharacterized protein LOC111386752 isoform X2 n=1 Tax=Olea europaea var. sylvestris TaxID=158386 RepID=UPI000C1D8024|nr:uncharacterized protein LOC111386752 isoform X2 [Olea europaea var. sylvestris]
MGRKPNVSEPTRWASLILLLIGLVSCSMIYMFVILVLRPSVPENDSNVESLALAESDENGEKWVNGVKSGGATGGLCCKGIDNLELWGAAVKWGTDFKFNSSGECCKACKAMCTGNDGPCLCDTWVFCGNKQACGNKFGECWLKKQKDILVPEKQDVGNKVMWTSGVVFGRGELFPDCSPLSVKYILELLAVRHCAGCHFYRAESRGQSWDAKGKHIEDASFGPPFALVQGTLDAQGMTFNKIPSEYCPTIRRGSVAWVGSGPEFFISLANHEEWKNSYTVFGSVLPEDLMIAEKIAQLPKKSDVWNNINVSVLENPVPLRIQRMKISVS